MKLFVNNIFNKLYYDALYQSAAPFVLEAPGRAFYLVTIGEVLIMMTMLICILRF